MRVLVSRALGGPLDRGKQTAMPSRSPSQALAIAASASLALACGPTPVAPGAATPGPAQGDAARPAASATTPTGRAPGAPPAPSCADATCFVCGQVMCLQGFHCEVPRAGAPAACGSVAACATTPTCACLARHLRGCTCEDRGGVAHVTCG